MKKLSASIVSLLLFVVSLAASQPVHAVSSNATFKLCSETEADLLRLYVALFNREADQEGGDYWINEYRQGATLEDLAYWMSQGPEFSTRYRNVQTNSELVEKFYRNIFKRKPDAEGSFYWISQLNQGLAPHLTARWMAKSPELAKRYPYSVAASCPELEPAPPPQPVVAQPETQPVVTLPTAPANTYYQNCTHVWNVLGRPIYSSDPGYRSGLDRDGDGTGCESRPD